MNKHDMAVSAALLVPPSEEAAKALAGAADVCAAELTARLAQREDIGLLIGAGNIPLMETNHGNHFQYISSLAALYDPLSFVEIVIWVFRTYRAHGFAVDYWKVMLPEAKAVLFRHLDTRAATEIGVIYDWLLEHIPDFTILSEQEPSLFETMSNLGRHHASDQ